MVNFALLFAWFLNELLLSLVLWGAYQLILRFNFRAQERYLYLKASFLVLPILPFASFPRVVLPTSFEILPVQVLPSLHITNSEIITPVPHQVFFSSELATFLLVSYALIVLLKIYPLVRSAFWLKRIKDQGECITVWPSIPIVLHDSDLPPATIGFFKPVILISRATYQALSPEQLTIVIAHETGHIRRMDFIFNLGRLAIATVLFYSPFIYSLSRSFEEEMELSCDERLLHESKLNRKTYGNLLLDISTALNPQPNSIYNGFFKSKPFIQRRIIAMQKEYRPSRLSLLTLILTSTVIISAASVSALEISKKARQEFQDNSGVPSSALLEHCTSETCSPELKHFIDQARSGNGSAENKVGELFLSGTFVKQDFEIARQWFLRASLDLDSTAPNHLGRLYLNGEGVAKDQAEACRWYALSAQRGDQAGTQNSKWCESHGGNAFQSKVQAQKSAYKLRIKFSLNGKLISEPQVIVRDGATATLKQQSEKELSSIRVTPRAGTLHGHSGILLQFAIETIHSGGAPGVIATPLVMVNENSPGKITWTSDQDKAAEYSLSVVANKVAMESAE